MQAYGGNSGSPVFFLPGLLHFGTEPASPEKLIGIIRGNYGEFSPIVFLNTPTATLPLSRQNIGIAAVTPAYLLHDILFSDALKKLRAEHPVPNSPEKTEEKQ